MGRRLHHRIDGAGKAYRTFIADRPRVLGQTSTCFSRNETMRLRLSRRLVFLLAVFALGIAAYMLYPIAEVSMPPVMYAIIVVLLGLGTWYEFRGPPDNPR